MPTFGDFETIDEPIESREDRRHVTQVWQAVRISVKDGRLYAVKCFTPRHGRRTEETPKEELEEHRTLEFLEGVKQIKKASSEGQKYLTPIHEFGLTPSGDSAWYATDFYGDRTLRSYITRGGRVDAEALRHTIHSVVLGCLAMKRSRGCSHGNIKTTNVFRTGKPRALRKTPLVLGDAFPVAPRQMAGLDQQNKLEVGDLINATMEAHDLRALGELILQMVEVRLAAHEGDYDFPMIPSPAWNSLGKEGERWRQLCNRLLDPSLSLERVNLEMLEKELRPGVVSTHAPMMAGAAVLLCLVGFGGYFGWHYYEQARAAQRQKTYAKDMGDARTALGASDADPARIMEAARLVEEALQRVPSNPDALQLKTEVEAKRESLYGQAFSQGTNDLAAGRFEESVNQLKIATILKPDDTGARRFYDQAQAQMAAVALAGQKEAAYASAMKNARRLFAAGDFTSALGEARKALLIKPDDPDARKLQDDAQTQLTAISQASQKESNYQTAMKVGRASFTSGDYTDALAKARQALSIKTDDPDARKLQEDAQTQLAAISQASQKDSNYQTAMKAGRASFTSGDYTDALAKASQALSIKPNDPDARKLQEDAQTQLAAISQASQKESNYQAVLKAGRESFASGDYTDALAKARQALSIKPNDPDARKLQEDAQTQLAAISQASQKESNYQAVLKAGRESFASGDYTDALAKARQALSIKPNDPDARKLQEDAQTQLAAISQASQKESNYQAAMKAGRRSFASGDYSDALAKARQALSIKPNDPDARKLQDDAQTQLAAISQKQADYQAAMNNGKQLLALGDADATKLQPALDQFQLALNSKPGDADATADFNEVRGRIDKAFALAFETGSKEALAGNKEEANRQLARMKVFKPQDAQISDLAAIIAKIAVPRPSLKRPLVTNFSDFFGQNIPDLNFVWVDGIGPGGSGAYAAINELSWEQYQALGGSEKPISPDFFAHRPAGLEFAKAQALVDSLNASSVGKKVKFRLPKLEEYKTLSGVTDFSAVGRLVLADTSAGESFKRPGDLQPREIVGVLSTNKVGLRNVIGNVREWTAEGVPFGNSYAWGQSGLYSLTNAPRTDEQIGLRLIGEPAN